MKEEDMRKGHLELKADLLVASSHLSGTAVFEEVLNALKSLRTFAHIRIQIRDLRVQIE
jgi:hypothetical protein